MAAPPQQRVIIVITKKIENWGDRGNVDWKIKIYGWE